MNGTIKEPFVGRAERAIGEALATVAETDVEREVAQADSTDTGPRHFDEIGNLIISSPASEPSAIGDVAETVETAAAEIERVAKDLQDGAARIAEEGRALAARMRAETEAYEQRVGAFARTAQQACLAVRASASNVETAGVASA